MCFIWLFDLSESTKIIFDQGFALNPTGGAYNAVPDSLVG